MLCLLTTGKIKCDEQKPDCSQCNRRQIACEYQPLKFRWKHGLVRSTEPCLLDTSPMAASTVKSTSSHEYAMPPLDPAMPMDFSVPMCNLSDTWSFSGRDSLPWSDFDWTPAFLCENPLADVSFLGSECSHANTDGRVSSPSSLPNPNFALPAPSLSAPDFPDSTPEAPTKHEPAALPQMRSDATTTFISYYFHYVAPMLSCCRQIENPFITDVSQQWNTRSARSLPYVLHSMSLACLAGSTPGLKSLAGEFREKAKRILAQEMENSPGAESEHSTELSLILLGASASWTQPHDSMLDLFQKFVIMSSRQSVPTQMEPFQEGIKTYWWMFLTFMSSPEPRLAYLASSTSHAMLMSHINAPPVTNAHPHPWTGISAEIITLLTQVGQLIRHHEATASVPHSGLCNTCAHESAARLLESRLLQHYKFNGKSHVSGPYSTETTLLRLSELYQTAALLQLYRVFPTLATKPKHQTYETQLGLKLFKGAGRDQYLLNMARHILKVALEADPASQSLRFQLVPVVIACSELRLPGVSNDELSASQPLSLLMHQTSIIQLAEARRLAKNHFMVMQRVFPGERISRVTSIVSAMWEQLDRNDPDEGLHWIKWLLRNSHDVM